MWKNILKNNIKRLKEYLVITSIFIKTKYNYNKWIYFIGANRKGGASLFDFK
jgi:hypothetical protein